MDMTRYIGTLVKLINLNNMSEIWGTLEDYSDGFFTLSKSVVIVNRATADLAQTFDDIIQYKFNGKEFGSTISSPLSPIFDNVEGKSIAMINSTNIIFIPLYLADDKDKVSSEIVDIKERQAIEVKETMLAYINNVYRDYTKMAAILLDNETQDDTTETSE